MSTHEQYTLGVVSYLNARPLIEGLDAGRGFSLHYDVPSALPAMLRHGEVDAALIPVVDLARQGGRASGPWRRVSDAGIACDGDSMTVRVFARVPPQHLRVLHVDDDSHTSVALAQLIWARMYHRPLRLAPLSTCGGLDTCEAVLLIGDKVINAPVDGFEHEIDLGGAWKAWTGLPFVFAVWAASASGGHATAGDELRAGAGLAGARIADLAERLQQARDRGVARAAELAVEEGARRGWPHHLAEEYLTSRMKYRLDEPYLRGMRMFLAMASEEGIIGDVPELVG